MGPKTPHSDIARPRLLRPVMLVLALAVTTRPAFTSAQPTPDVIEVDVQTLATGTVESRLRLVISLCEQRDWSALTLALSDDDVVIRRMVTNCWDVDEAGSSRLWLVFDDPDQAVRTATVQRLSQSSAIDADTLSYFLGDPSPEVRAAAISGLGRNEVRSRLRQILADPSLIVVQRVAEVLGPLPADGELDPVLSRRYQLGVQLSLLGDDLPEVRGAIITLDARVQAVGAWLRSRPTPDLCADAAYQALNGVTVGLVDLAVPREQWPADSDRFDQLILVEDQLSGISDAYSACGLAQPLQLVAVAASSGRNARNVVARAEVGSLWLTDFGMLRPTESTEGGELRVSTELSAQLFLPGRAPARSAPTTHSSFSLVGQARNDMLYRLPELSSWSGGGVAFGHLPFGCAFSACRFDSRLWANRSFGDESVFPTVLVSEHNDFGVDLRLNLASVAPIEAQVEARRITYTDPRLDVADFNRLIGSVGTLPDATVQLRVEAARHDFDQITSRTDRDSTLLTAMLGIHFAPPQTQGLSLLTLGGAAIPLLDAERLEVSPQVTFGARLLFEPDAGQGWSLRIGGIRRVEAAPISAVLQGVTETEIVTDVQIISAPESGFDLTLGAIHDLVQPLGVIDDPDANPNRGQDTNRIRLVLGIRAFVAEWFGIDVREEAGWLSTPGRDFDFFNRFHLGFFVPMGGHGLDREEEMPW